MAVYDLGNVKGVGIANIEQTTSSIESSGDNVVTITTTDDKEYTFTIKNGTGLDLVNSLTSEDTGKALSANNGKALSDKIAEAKNLLLANQFGNGTATCDNANGIINVTITNYPDVTELMEGARFRIVFTNDYTYDGQPKMIINEVETTEDNVVTVGAVAAGIGAFQKDKSYEFCFTGSSYDCLSSEYSAIRTYSAVSTNTITLADGWKKLFISVRYDSLNFQYTLDEYNSLLSNNENYLCSGYYGNSNSYTDIRVSYKDNVMYIKICNINGASRLSSAYLTVKAYY